MSSGTLSEVVAGLDRSRPLLIAGPTASGKSALAMAAAKRLGGPVVNADAIQVYADWRVLTARPTVEDEAAVPHRLYGHIPGDQAYSVGHWLREVRPLLDGPPPVIVGGTGLYFMALTEGLADIPATPDAVREEANARLVADGVNVLLADLDAETTARIDTANPMRVQRAWEVLRATGRGLAAWQDDTGPPLLPSDAVQRLVLDAPKEWLCPRIERRLAAMIDAGALDEARANAPDWTPERPSAKAIGARQLIAVARGELDLDAALPLIATETRQYAKRQRTWFRRRMREWTWISPTG